MWRRVMLGLVALLTGVAVALGVVGPAQAAPAGAATNLSFTSQQCYADGTVSGLLTWTPSNLGTQYADLALDAGFTRVSTGGPYAGNADRVSFTNLVPGTVYYARVRTVTGGQTLISDTFVVIGSCPVPQAITRPVDLVATTVGPQSIAVRWTPGTNNRWFCVDTARSLSDLLNLSNTWRNHGCWTTASAMTITGLSCSTNYYWLVYAWNETTNVKSDPSVASTASCASTISAPTNLHVHPLDGDIMFDWDAGMGNVWFCVDTAKSESDLRSLTGTWRNHGCWTTASQLVISELDCGEAYYWLVYSWNNLANVKSATAVVDTEECEGRLELAPIEDVDVVKVDGSYRAEILAALPNACHSPESYSVQRFTNTIEIKVWNRVVSGPCAFVYDTYELTVNLGSNLVDGRTYEVIVNDEVSDTFTVE